MMKREIKYGAVVALLCGFVATACNKEDYLLYDTSQQDGAYIAYEQNESTVDSIHYEYGFLLDTVAEINIPVKLMGMPVGHDRKFEVEVIKEQTTMSETVHYTIDREHLVIPANELAGTLAITLYRENDPKLVDSTYVLSLQLKETEDLHAVEGQSSFLITYSDRRPGTPPWWRTWNLGDYHFEVAQWFFHYFYLTEEINPAVFNELIERYGDYFVKAGDQQGPLDMYSNFFAKYVLQPLYEHYLDDPDITIPKPNIY